MAAGAVTEIVNNLKQETHYAPPQGSDAPHSGPIPRVIVDRERTGAIASDSSPTTITSGTVRALTSQCNKTSRVGRAILNGARTSA